MVVGSRQEQWRAMRRSAAAWIPGASRCQGTRPMARCANWSRSASPRSCSSSPTCIRALKTRYHRISGRKNWKELERTGTAICCAMGARWPITEWWVQDVPRLHKLVEHASRLDRVRWRELLRQASTAQREQLDALSFPSQTRGLPSIEERWAAASMTFALTVFASIQ